MLRFKDTYKRVKTILSNTKPEDKKHKLSQTDKQSTLSIRDDHSPLLQELEPRLMFDGAAIETVDLADGVSEQEQVYILNALEKNEQAHAAESLLEAIAANAEGFQTDYSQFREVVIIDARVQDPHVLIDSISRDAAIEVILPEQDGVDKITDILSKYSNLDAVHIISHGDQAQLQLGSTTLNSSNLTDYQVQLAAWGDPLAQSGDMLFYGCNVAEGEKGQEFVNQLKTLISADIAASDNITSSVSYSGDSYFEYKTGDILQASIVDFEDWQYKLSLPNASELFVTNDQAIILNNSTREIRLTNGNNSDAVGSAMSKITLDFSSDFAMDFDIKLSSYNHDSGADGIAFILHNSPDGSSAKGLYGSSLGAQGIEHGIALEFDTFYNGTSDNNLNQNDHSMVWDTDGAPDLSNKITNSSLVTTDHNLEDASWYNVNVNWHFSTSTLSYTVKDLPGTTTYLSDSFSNTNLIDGYFNSSDQVYFGWSASTGAASNDQLVRLNSITANIPPVLDLDGATSSNNYTTSFTENSLSPVVLSNFQSDGGVININSSTLTSAQITLLNYESSDNFNIASEQQLSITNSGIAWNISIVGNNKVLTFTTIEGQSPTNNDYDTALAAVKYISDSEHFTNTTKIFEFEITNELNQTSEKSTTTLSLVNINDAPVVNGNGTLSSINEDNETSVGDTISSLLGNTVSDPDGVLAPEGIAIVAVDDMNGQWQYTIDGVTWQDITGVSDTGAILLGADSDDNKIRFVPDTNFNGNSGSITYRAWDQSSGSNGQTGVNVSVNGGITAFSSSTATASVVVNAVNDAPVVNGNGTLSSINEDNETSVGDTISSLLGNTVSDPDGVLAPEGIAIVAVDDMNGQWQYTIDGVTWQDITGVSDTGAILLGADSDDNKIRFVPDTNFNGNSGSITYRAWDQSSGSNGQTGVNVSVNGGITAFSSSTETASVVVNAVNDAPILTVTGRANNFFKDSTSVGLFSNANISTIEAGQLITEIKVTAANLKDGANELLIVDSEAITLTNGVAITTLNNAYIVNVSETLGIVVVNITKTSNMTTGEAQAVIDGLSYTHLPNNITNGLRSFTLASVQDDGGTSNGGVNAINASISSTVQVMNLIVPHGSVVSELSDNIFAITLPSGKTVDVQSGATVVENNDGSVTVNTANGGSITIPDGSTVIDNNDGTITIVDGFGNSITSKNNATISVSHDENRNIKITDETSGTSVIVPNGAEITVNPDNTITVIDQYGNTIISREGATMTIIDNNDGTITVSDNLTNESVTAPNGTNFIVNPDGSITAIKSFKSDDLIYDVTLLSSGFISYINDNTTYQVIVDNLTTTFEVGFVVLEKNNRFQVFDGKNEFQMSLGMNSTRSNLINDQLSQIKSILSYKTIDYKELGAKYHDIIEYGKNLGLSDLIETSWLITKSTHLNHLEMNNVFVEYILSLNDQSDKKKLIDIFSSNPSVSISDLHHVVSLLRANGLNKEAEQILEIINEKNSTTDSEDYQNQYDVIKRDSKLKGDDQFSENESSNNKKDWWGSRIKNKIFSQGGFPENEEIVNYSALTQRFKIELAKAKLLREHSTAVPSKNLESK